VPGRRPDWSYALLRKTACSAGCGAARSRPGARYCRACHAAYMRRWRARRVAAERELQAELRAMRKLRDLW